MSAEADAGAARRPSVQPLSPAAPTTGVHVDTLHACHCLFTCRLRLAPPSSVAWQVPAALAAKSLPAAGRLGTAAPPASRRLSGDRGRHRFPGARRRRQHQWLWSGKGGMSLEGLPSSESWQRRARGSAAAGTPWGAVLSPTVTVRLAFPHVREPGVSRKPAAPAFVKQRGRCCDCTRGRFNMLSKQSATKARFW